MLFKVSIKSVLAVCKTYTYLFQDYAVTSI